MKGSDDQVFKQYLKELIVDACGKDDVSAADIADDEALFGEQARLGLDSLDGLQISMAIQREFGVRVSDSKEMRRILHSVNGLADYLRPE